LLLPLLPHSSWVMPLLLSKLMGVLVGGQEDHPGVTLQLQVQQQQQQQQQQF